MTGVKTDPDSPKSSKPPEKIAISVKRPTKKKPKDKPKRPLSAYNFFFKEEREKILKVVLSDEPHDTINEPDSEDFIDDDQLGRLRKEGGKVSFEAMGKLIGTRWKALPPDRLTKYSELAAEDTDRYKKEMQAYNGRQEEKMRDEVRKPAPSNPYPQEIPKSSSSTSRDTPTMQPPPYDMHPAVAYQQHMQGYGYPPQEYGYPGMGAYGYGGGYPPEMAGHGYPPEAAMPPQDPNYAHAAMYGAQGYPPAGNMGPYGGQQGGPPPPPPPNYPPQGGPPPPYGYDGPRQDWGGPGPHG